MTAAHANALVRLSRRGKILHEARGDLSPASPYVADLPLPRRTRETDLTLAVLAADGSDLIRHTPQPRPKKPVPPPATEPPAPRDIRSADELYVTGLHLEQYRHATRSPIDYWREALRRDPGDARCNNVLGLWHLRRGEFTEAEKFFRAAIARLTSRNPNPADGEPYYNLGVCLRFQADSESKIENRESKISSAYDAFAKSTWNAASQPAAFHALAELDCRRADWPRALAHLDAALRLDTDNLSARDLKALVLRRLGRAGEADVLVAATLALDPLDWWARDLRGDALECDTQVRLDLAHDYARAGFFREALDLLASAMPEPASGTASLVAYTAAWLCNVLRYIPEERGHLAEAAKASPDYCFPARLEEIAVLRHAIAANPRDARAPYYLGNLLYDRRRHREAIALWEKSSRLDPSFSIVWRNLGIGYFNIAKNPARAHAAYERAVRANPGDARLLYERDQLWKRLGVAPTVRVAELTRHGERATARDDLALELCALFNQAGRHAEALLLLSGRRFQPWEGGEGVALGQHARTHLALGRDLLAAGDIFDAARLFAAALEAPENLGEAKHLLANQSDIHFWLGTALGALGDRKGARAHWTTAANFRGDFQAMSVRAFSEMTYWSARALEKLGRRAAAKKLFRDLLAYARRLARMPAKIDYFATSLPTMLLFDDDLQARQLTTVKFLEAQARLGLGQTVTARRLLRDVLRRDPSHAAAADLLAENSFRP